MVMGFLFYFSSVVNFLAYIVTLWLGLYIITRSPRTLLSWLTSISLWSTGGFFLNGLLAIYPPPAPNYLPVWLQLFFPFWSPDAFQTGWSSWLAGWNVTPAIAFWHHATVLLRKAKPGWGLKIQTAMVYGVAIFTIYTQRFTPYFFTSATGNPLDLDSLSPGPFYLVIISFLVIFFLLCLFNLALAIKNTSTSVARKQISVLILATVIAGFTSLTALTLVVPEIGSIPRVVNAVLLFISISLVGYSVARYSALIDGRAIRRDFLYNAAMISVIVLIYAAFTWISIILFNIPATAFVLVICLAIVTHSLIDFIRRYLEVFLYRKDERIWRENLRRLANSAGKGNFKEILNQLFSTFCENVRASYGLLVLFEGASVKVDQKYQLKPSVHLQRPQLLSDDILPIEADHFSPTLEDVALLVPLYREDEQIGAVILGCPVNGLQYPEEDVLHILDATDQISDVISSNHQEINHLLQAVDLSHNRIIHRHSRPDHIPVEVVEKVLRRINDFSYLGDSELSHLKIVQERIPEEAVTHVDLGKAVFQVVGEAVEKLRPSGDCEADPPPREWYPYCILYWAYFEDKLNREIIAQLYISEGTFNRTRRTALRSLARVLSEMETAYV